MRTTVSLDDELLLELKEQSRKENVSLTKLVNRLLRRGLEVAKKEGKATRRYRERVFSMGEPEIDIDKALQLASAFEDAEVSRKISLRK